MTFPEKFPFQIVIQFDPVSILKRDWKHKFNAHGKSILNVSLYNTLEPAQKNSKQNIKVKHQGWEKLNESKIYRRI